MIPLSLPHSSIGYFTTPSSFRSRVRVIVSVSTPILYPTTSLKCHGSIVDRANQTSRSTAKNRRS